MLGAGSPSALARFFACSTSSSSVMLSNEPTSPISLRSIINPNTLALPSEAIAIAEPLRAFFAICRASSSSANINSRVVSTSCDRCRFLSFLYGCNRLLRGGPLVGREPGLKRLLVIVLDLRILILKNFYPLPTPVAGMMLLRKQHTASMRRCWSRACPNESTGASMNWSGLTYRRSPKSGSTTPSAVLV